MYLSLNQRIETMKTKLSQWPEDVTTLLRHTTTTCNRLLAAVLHAKDNELLKKQGEPGYDRLHKVRPLLTIISGSWISQLPEFVGNN